MLSDLSEELPSEYLLPRRGEETPLSKELQVFYLSILVVVGVVILVFICMTTKLIYHGLRLMIIHRRHDGCVIEADAITLTDFSIAPEGETEVTFEPDEEDEHSVDDPDAPNYESFAPRSPESRV